MTNRAPLLRSAASGLAGFVVYGGWAWFWNMEHGAMGQRAGLLQGSYSFVLTFFSTLMMEWIYRRCAQAPLARLLTIALTGVMLLAIPVTLHAFAGTPNIVGTILPGFLIGMGYTTAYVTALARVSALDPRPREA
ncbi:MAG: hypothetical protein V2J24_13665 [Pseudomonadales bacterium]|nr:hypothetical protein [Pseudomonadales bacterium]